MVVGQRTVATEDEDTVIIERRGIIAAPHGELDADDRLTHVVPDDALQLQPEVRVNAEVVLVRLYQLLHLLI